VACKLRDVETNENKIYFVIPAFNEEAVVKSVVSEIISKGFHVVVVDDCSHDETFQLATEAGAWVLRHPVNLGQGAALQTGILFALSHHAEYIVTFDADGQHRVQDAVKMIRVAKRKTLDVVIGSRFLKGRPHSMPLTRFVILKLAILFTRLTSRLSVTDTHNGLRVLSAASASRIELRQNRMAHASEILSHISTHRLKWEEYPTKIVYTKYSVSKGQKSSGFVSIIFDLLLGRFR